MKYLTAAWGFLKTAWDYLLDGVDYLAGFVSRHPRKVAIAIVVYAAFRLYSAVF